MRNNLRNSIQVQFLRFLGPDIATCDPSKMMHYLKEWRGIYHGQAIGLVKPYNTNEVAKTIQIAKSLGLKIIPHGGNTGLVGGQIPQNNETHLILSLERLNQIRKLDLHNNSLVAEAGVILEHIQKAADNNNRLFPIALGSQGSCQIGGIISTNAGGTAVLSYGNTRDLVLGLEVVLANGQIWNGLRTLRKDNSGYDIKQLFIGAEGTLGIVTAAVLKLFPKPLGKQVAFFAFNDLNDVLTAFHKAQEQAGMSLTTFEIIPKIGLDFVTHHISGTRNPLPEQNYPWYALVEICSQQSEAHAEMILHDIFEYCFEKNYAIDAAIATSQQQQADFWRLRHALSEAQKYEGGSIKHDISVPVASIPRFIQLASQAVQKAIPDSRPVAFGHFGDGNIHFNISQPLHMDKTVFLEQSDRVNDIVHQIAIELEGSISAEHGIGRLKAKFMPIIKSEIELDLMRKIKNSLDPDNILNPGVIFESKIQTNNQ